MGCFIMPKEIPDKRYTPEFKEAGRRNHDEEKAEFSELLNFFEDQPDIVALIERILNKEGE